MIEGGRPLDMVQSAQDTERDAKRSDPQNRVKRGETRMAVKLDVNRPLAHMCRVIVKAIEAKRRSRDRHSTKMPRGQKRQYPEDFHHRRKTVHGG